MEDSQTSSAAPDKPHGLSAPVKSRKKRRWPYVVILILIILPILGYALLPWLIPTAWLKSQIVTGIKTQFGREASISSVELSWGQGIIVRDITIKRLEEFGPGNLFQASKLQLDFRPLRFLLGHRLGTVRVDQPSLWVVADAAGKLNISSLPPQPETAGFDLISITNTNFYFIDRAYDRQGLISIALISVARDPQTGQYSFLAKGEPNKTTGWAAFTLQVSFVPPSQQPKWQKTDVIGSAELAWLDFDLSALTVPSMGRIDCQAISGRTSGRARLELHSDARIELYDCSAGVDDLYLRLAESAGPDDSKPSSTKLSEIRIPRAQVGLRGSYEFISGELAVEDLSGLLDGLDFDTSFQGRFLQASGTFVPSGLSLTAKVQPSRLREQLPFLDSLLRQGDLTVTGSSNVALDFKQSDQIDRLSLSLDALDMGLHVPNLLHKSADIPCRIGFAAEIDHTTGLVKMVEPLRGQLASGSFSFDMYTAQPVPMLSFLNLLTQPDKMSGLVPKNWSGDYLSASLDLGRIEDFTTVFPKLAPVFSAIKLTGPVQAQFFVEPAGIQDNAESNSDDGRTVIRASLSLPTGATLDASPHFHKPPDEALTLSFTARLAEKDHRIEDLNGSCRLGDFVLAIDKASFSLTPDLSDLQSVKSPADLLGLIDSVSADGQFQLENAEALNNVGISLQPLKSSGNLSGRFDLRYSSDKSLNLNLALDATALACEIPKDTSDAESPVLFKKPSGTTAQLDLQFQTNLESENRSANQPVEHLGSDTVRDYPFQVRLGFALADSLGSLQIERTDTVRFDLKVPQLNLDTLSNHAPALAKIMENYQLGGNAILNISGSLDRDLQLKDLNLTADLTDISCVLSDSSAESAGSILLQKLPEQSLSCRVGLVIDPPDSQGRRRVSVKSAALDLAQSRLELAGDLLLKSSDEFEFDSILWSQCKSVESFWRLGPVARAEFSSTGHVDFNEDLLYMLPHFAQIEQELGLAGTLDYTIDITAEPDQLMLKIVCDGGPEGMTLGPVEFKRMAQQLDLSFSPAVEGSALSSASLTLEALELDLLDEPLRMSGVVNLDAGRLIIPDLLVALGESAVHCTARVQNIWTAPVGYVDLYSPLIDQPYLQDLATRMIATASPRATSAEADSTVNVPTEAEALKDEQVKNGLHLPPMDITVRLQCDKFILKDPATLLNLDFEQVDLDGQLTSSSLVAGFTTALNGGRIGNAFTISFDEPGLPLTYRYEALEMVGDENTAPMVSQVFPDMTVKGTITESRTIVTDIIPHKDSRKFPKEQGRTVLEDGVLVGPSAPWWVTRWFPKLSLTEYHFEIADNVFTRNPEDGSVANDMVFVGKGRYNTYINGITLADNTTKYTVGVDLSRFMTLDQRHNWKQFRVPLLTYSGLIVDGKWAKQTVSFTWPTRAAWEILIKNNSLKTLIERRRQAD